MRSCKLKHFVKKIVSAVACFALIIASLGIFVPEDSYDVSALSSSEIQQKINEKSAEQKKIQEKIDALKGDKANAKERAENLEAQVQVITEKVDLINARISSLNSEIEQKEQEIKAKEDEIKEAKELLKKRLRAIYVAGASTDLLVLLSAEDYADFLQKTEVMKCITSDTKDMMTKLENEIKVINDAKKKIEDNKKEADVLQQQLVTEQNNLDEKYSEAQSAYSEIAKTEDELKAEANKLEAEKDKLQEEFDRLAREAANNSSMPSVNIDGGSYGFAWPYGGSYYISSGYGYRIHPTLGYSKLHGGIDITGSGAYGKPIYAIADGRVILSQYYDSYGNCVMIDHGKYNGTSIVSLYAHASSLVVGNGASVKKGQLIAYVGSSGRSTGPHLHFEIRANGNRVNPLDFYSNY